MPGAGRFRKQAPRGGASDSMGQWLAIHGVTPAAIEGGLVELGAPGPDADSTAKAPRAKPVQREGIFLGQVRQAARLKGWSVYHTLRSDGSDEGYPDLELARAVPYPRIIKAELKDTGRKPSEAQVAWLDLYARIAKSAAVLEVYLWYPSQWEAILDVLEPDFLCVHTRADCDRFGCWL